MTVQAATRKLQSLIGSIAGVRDAPVDPPESANVFPFVVTYVKSGNFTLLSADWLHTFPTLVVELHVERENLPSAVDNAMRYFEPIVQLLMANPTLDATISTVTSIRYKFGYLTYGGIQTIGWQFEIDCKMKVTGA